MKKCVVIFFCIFLLISCKEKEEIKPEKIVKILNEAQKKEIDYNTLVIRKFNAIYRDDKFKFSSKGYLKNINDSVLIISLTPILGIEVARIYCDKDSLFVLNKPERTIYYNSLEYYSNLFNIDITLNDLENILLNNFFLLNDLDKKEIKNKAKVINNNYYIEIENNNAKEELFVDKNYNVVKRNISNIDNSINIVYDDFKTINSYNYPANIGVTLVNGEKTLNLQFRINDMELNKEVTVKRIDLNKYKKIPLK